MNRQEIEQRVNDIIVDTLGIEAEELKPNVKLEDEFDADSLDAIDIIIRLEDTFGIEFEPEELALNEYTPTRIADIVEEKIKNTN